MQKIIDAFKCSITSTKEMRILYDYLERNHFDAVDYSDLLRWMWAEAVSILDKFIHEMVLFGTVDVFVNNKPKTTAFKNFTITVEQYENIVNMNQIEAESTIRNIISVKHSYESFQDPDKIKKALNLIWEDEHKFQQIALKMGLEEIYIKTKLKNIIVRRNQIVHQNDMLANDFEKEEIKKEDASNVVDFIETFGIAIYDCVHPPQQP